MSGFMAALICGFCHFIKRWICVFGSPLEMAMELIGAISRFGERLAALSEKSKFDCLLKLEPTKLKFDFLWYADP